MNAKTTGKVCTRCGERKELSAFYKFKGSKDGHHYCCKECRNSARHGERQRNKANHDDAFYERAEADPSAVRTCTDCGETKHFAHYGRLRTNHCGYSFYCKVCRGVRVWSSLAVIPFTGQDYARLLARQRGVCAICGGANPEGGRRLAIDHCHKTRVVRGLLCDTCNRSIGLLKDDPRAMRAAANYVESAGSAMWLSDEPISERWTA